MLPGINLPASLSCLLGELRPCFTAPGFATFCGLIAGLAGQVRRRTVVGMLLGGALQHAWPHDRAHYFFARARWELDQLGLAVAQLAVMLLAGPGKSAVAAQPDQETEDLGSRLAVKGRDLGILFSLDAHFGAPPPGWHSASSMVCVSGTAVKAPGPGRRMIRSRPCGSYSRSSPPGGRAPRTAAVA